MDELIQNKGDFLAELATEPLATSRPAMLVREVLLPWVQNTLLMDALARNEGVGYPTEGEDRLRSCGLRLKIIINDKKFCIKYSDTDRSYTYTYPPELPYTYPYSTVPEVGDIKDGAKWLKPLPPFPDLEVALPGAHGEMAIYGILENYVRNIAKYHKEYLDTMDYKHIEIILRVNDRSDSVDYYDVSLSSNLWTLPDDGSQVGASREELARFKKRFDQISEEDVVNPKDGSLIREHWGLAEIRISAALLQGSRELTLPALKKGVEIDWDQENRCLQYKFKLMRSKLAAVVWPTVDPGIVENLKRCGIWVFGDFAELIEHLKDSPAGASFKFAVIGTDAGGLDDLENFLCRLPFRVMLIGKEGKNQQFQGLVDQRRVVIDDSLKGPIDSLCTSEPIDQDALRDTVNDVSIELWKVWVKLFFGVAYPDDRASLALWLGPQERNEFSGKRWEKVQQQLRIRDNEAIVLSLTKETFEIREHNVVYDRHGELGLDIKTKLDKTDSEEETAVTGVALPPLLNDAVGYMVLDKASSDFISIYAPDFPDRDREKSCSLPWEMVEAGLLKILVIDERLAERALDPVDPSGDYRSRLNELVTGEASEDPGRIEWAWAANVFLCTHIECDGHDDPQPLHDSLDQRNRGGDEDDAMATSAACQFVLGYKAAERALQVRWKYRTVQGMFDERDLDMIIVHQGVLDTLEQDLGVQQECFLKKAQNTAPFVIIESGRGPQLQQGYKFMPYTLLQQYLHSRIAKLSLASVSMSIGRRFESKATTS